MALETQKNQGLIRITSQEGSSQEGYLPIAVNAFLVDRRAQNMTGGTLHFYEKKLSLWLKYCDGQLINQVTQITPDTIRQYLFWLDQSGHNPGGIHACYRALKTFLLWVWEEYEINGKNPIGRVKPPKLATEPLQPIAPDVFSALLDTCNKSCNKSWYGVRDKAILLTLLDSGVRAAELCALDVGDLDITSGALEIRQGKGRKPRLTFVGNITRRALRAWLKVRVESQGDTTGALFITHTGDRLTYFGLRQIIRRRADLADCAPPGLHDFRRAFCLSQLQAGVSETSIARLMGHTTTQLIARYAKQTGRDLHDHYKSPVDKK